MLIWSISVRTPISYQDPTPFKFLLTFFLQYFHPKIASKRLFITKSYYFLYFYVFAIMHLSTPGRLLIFEAYTVRKIDVIID
jgi:hypothetical protein